MLTILTATYNRAELLYRLYNSLKQQTDKNFEWLIIDDGSNDDTCLTVDEWKKENQINIRYIWQENMGKSRAVNRGVLLAHGEFTAIMDSDDYFLPFAVEEINRAASQIGDNIAGVFFSQGICEPNGELKPNGNFRSDKEYIDMENHERNSRAFCGDRLEVVRTNLMKSHPFPEFAGEKFIPESTMFNAICADGYKLRIYKKILCVIEYLDKGMSKSFDKIRRESFEGYAYSIKMLLKCRPMRKCFWVVWNYAKIADEKGLTAQKGARKIGANPFLFKILLFLTRIIKK